MTTTKTRDSIGVISSGIELEIAEWNDVVKVLKESYTLWGGGLTREKYYEWTSSQFHHPWAKKNYRFLVSRHNGRQGKIVSSCKLYLVEWQSRGRSYRIAGVGAVYTPERFRGHGYAGQMLETLESRCRADGFDAMLLFSEIDTLFYERLGYETMPNCDFHIWITDPQVERWIMSDTSFAEDLHEHAPDVALVESEDVPHMIRLYRRYLANQSYGTLRTESYWAFKLQRERFRHNNSTNWPAIEIMSIDLECSHGGYALFEQGGHILRVLEVVGDEPTRELLWRNLLRTALLRRVQLVRGWEAIAPTFVKGLKYAPRDWGQPMMLSFNKDLENLLDLDDCPILELDHF